jgi:hypothetical protein
MDVRPQSDRGFREELRAQRRADRSENRATRRQERLERREARRREREAGDGSPTQPVTPPPGGATIPTPVSSAPVPTQSSPSTGPNVRSLAEKYVDVYAQQSGRSLSSATREALVNDVASFYGESGGRTERLKTLVGVF